MPEWLTVREAATRGPLSEGKIRSLIHSGELEYAKPGGRYLLPDHSVDDYIRRNLRKPQCQDVTKGPDCAGSPSAAPTMSSGVKAAGAASAARALQIASKLKRSSQDGSESDSEGTARATQLRSS